MIMMMMMMKLSQQQKYYLNLHFFFALKNSHIYIVEFEFCVFYFCIKFKIWIEFLLKRRNKFNEKTERSLI